MINEITVGRSLLIKHCEVDLFIDKLNPEIKLQHSDINTGNRCLYQSKFMFIQAFIYLKGERIHDDRQNFLRGFE